jgi:hypothetical protein
MFWFFYWSLPLWLLHSSTPHARYPPFIKSSLTPSFIFLWQRVEVMELLIMQFSPTSSHFTSPCAKHSAQHDALKHPQSIFSPLRQRIEVLRLIVDAPWYVSNSVIRNDLQVPTVKEEISRFSSHYNVRTSVHPNELIAGLTEPPFQRRLRR